MKTRPIYQSELPAGTLERFMARTSRGEGDACWIWLGRPNYDGYGNFNLFGRRVNAHRVAYALFNGDLENGKTVDHLCRNRICVNPAHLESVDPRVNNLRGFSPPAINARRTTCKQGHPLDGHDGRQRFCSICRTNYHREWSLRKRAAA